MKYLLTLLMVSMFSICFSQNIEVEKHLTKRSNVVIDTTDMLGHNIKIITDKKGRKLYLEHTDNNYTRFIIYKNNEQIKRGIIITDNQLVMKSPGVTPANNKAGE